jgi:hypothetical protein
VKCAALQRLHGAEASFVEAHDAGCAIAVGEHHERAVGEAEVEIHVARRRRSR